MKNLIYSQMKPNEQTIRFQVIARVFFGFDSEFSWFFKWNFDFLFWAFTKFLESYSIDSLTKSAMGSLMNIKWIYLVFWVDIWALT